MLTEGGGGWVQKTLILADVICEQPLKNTAGKISELDLKLIRIYFFANGKKEQQARRGSISRLGFYTLEEHSRPPAGSFKGRRWKRVESKTSFLCRTGGAAT